MATTGTIGQTTFNTAQVIDNAYRLCKLPAQAITGEMISIAGQHLYMLLMELGNVGAPLWCIEKQILGMYQGVHSVPVPIGTVDVLNANLRQLQRLSGTDTASEGDPELAFDGDVDTETVQTNPAGWVQLMLDGTAVVTTVGLLPGATGVWDFSYQYSADGITWVTFHEIDDLAVVDRQWIWNDFQGLPAMRFWRLLARNTTVLEVRELVFGNTPQDIMLARINKDDYWNMPNKDFQGRPTEYWFNQKAQQRSIMEIWPAPNNEYQFYQLTLLTHRHIMDVGSMTQTLEIPDRWFWAIVAQLGARLASTTPEVTEATTVRCEKLAAEALRLAWMDQRDNSPVQIMPNISPYTK